MAMPHVRVTIAVHKDPSYRTLSLKARGMLITAHAYCTDLLTDGFLPQTFVSDHGRGHEARAAIRELVTKGWWVEEEDGFRSVTYLDDNPTRETVEEKLAGARDRQARHRRQRHLPWADTDAAGGAA